MPFTGTGKVSLGVEISLVVDAESPNQQRSLPATQRVPTEHVRFGRGVLVFVCLFVTCHFDCSSRCFHRRTEQWPHRQIVWLLLRDDVLTSSDQLPCDSAVRGKGLYESRFAFCSFVSPMWLCRQSSTLFVANPIKQEAV